MFYSQKYGTLLSIVNDRNEFKNNSKLRPREKRFMLMYITSTICTTIYIHNKFKKPLNTKRVSVEKPIRKITFGRSKGESEDEV